MKCDPRVHAHEPGGAATALTDLAAGGIDFVSCSMPEAEALIKAGRIRSLVFFSPKRAPNFPDVLQREVSLPSPWPSGLSLRLARTPSPHQRTLS